jgi:NAD(P)-dependent dehydrogenase (short-subunit alcohol dehydrogenase family)
VVTGAARGNRRAIAVEFAANGADVIALDIAGPVTEGMRNDQDVGKQDRRIKTKAANRLQRNLCRSFGIEAEIEKAARLKCGARNARRIGRDCWPDPAAWPPPRASRARRCAGYHPPAHRR